MATLEQQRMKNHTSCGIKVNLRLNKITNFPRFTSLENQQNKSRDHSRDLVIWQLMNNNE